MFLCVFVCLCVCVCVCLCVCVRVHVHVCVYTQPRLHLGSGGEIRFGGGGWGCKRGGVLLPYVEYWLPVQMAPVKSSPYCHSDETHWQRGRPGIYWAIIAHHSALLRSALPKKNSPKNKTSHDTT